LTVGAARFDTLTDGHTLPLCGPVFAYFVRKYEKQEARYHGLKKKDPFNGIKKSLIAGARKCLDGEKDKQ
jgi:hypothetical protein